MSCDPREKLKIMKATTEQDPALPQANAVVMNDITDGPPAQHRSMHQAVADDDDDGPFYKHAIDHSGQPARILRHMLLVRG